MSWGRGCINIFVQYTHVCAQYFKPTEKLLIDVFIFASYIFFSDTGNLIDTCMDVHIFMSVCSSLQSLALCRCRCLFKTKFISTLHLRNKSDTLTQLSKAEFLFKL